MSNIVPFLSPSEIAARVAVGGMPESSIPGSAKLRSPSAIESGGGYMSGTCCVTSERWRSGRVSRVRYYDFKRN